LMLQDALLEKDQRVRDLERWMLLKPSKSEPLQIKEKYQQLGGSFSENRKYHTKRRSSFAKLRNRVTRSKASLELRGLTSSKLIGEKQIIRLSEVEEEEGKFVNVTNGMTDSQSRILSLGSVGNFLRAYNHSPPKVIMCKMDEENDFKSEETKVESSIVTYESPSSSSSTMSNIIKCEDVRSPSLYRIGIRDQNAVCEKKKQRRISLSILKEISLD